MAVLYISKTNLAVESRPSGVVVAKTNLAVESRSNGISIAKTNLAVESSPGVSGRRRMSLW